MTDSERSGRAQRMKRLRRLAGAAALVGVVHSSPVNSAADPPQRIASINLCADQYLLAFVPRDRIVALSPFAEDAAMSAAAGSAAGLPKVKDDVESVLALVPKPDLVLASAYTKPATLELLKRHGIAVAAVPDAANFGELRAQIAFVADALDAPEQGAALRARLDAALDRLDGAGAGRRALYLDRGSFVTGGDTLIGALFEHAGLVNAADRLGIRRIAPASLEVTIAAEPDLLVTPGRSHATDQGALILQHPALARLAQKHTILLPVRETVCPGPSWISAIEGFADGLVRGGD